MLWRGSHEQRAAILAGQLAPTPAFLSFYVMTLSFINEYGATNHLQGARELLSCCDEKGVGVAN